MNNMHDQSVNLSKRAYFELGARLRTHYNILGYANDEFFRKRTYTAIHAKKEIATQHSSNCTCSTM